MYRKLELRMGRVACGPGLDLEYRYGPGRAGPQGFGPLLHVNPENFVEA
jgi:hypothetical protein